jgi:hypothetical protein
MCEVIFWLRRRRRRRRRRRGGGCYYPCVSRYGNLELLQSFA